MKYNTLEAKIAALEEARELAIHLENTLQRIHKIYQADLGGIGELRFREARIDSIELSRTIDEVHSWGIAELHKSHKDS